MLTTAALAQTAVSSLEVVAFLIKLLDGFAFLPFPGLRVLLLGGFAFVAAAAVVPVLATSSKVIAADFVHGVGVLGTAFAAAAVVAATLYVTLAAALVFAFFGGDMLAAAIVAELAASPLEILADLETGAKGTQKGKINNQKKKSGKIVSILWVQTSSEISPVKRAWSLPWEKRHLSPWEHSPLSRNSKHSRPPLRGGGWIGSPSEWTN